jgi:hypothetical protein
MIETMQSQLGAPDLLAALGASMMIFRPEWRARVEAGPRSALFAVVLIIGLLAFVGMNNR